MINYKYSIYYCPICDNKLNFEVILELNTKQLKCINCLNYRIEINSLNQFYIENIVVYDFLIQKNYLDILDVSNKNTIYFYKIIENSHPILIDKKQRKLFSKIFNFNNLITKEECDTLGKYIALL